MQSHTALLFLGTKSTASSFRRFSCNKQVHNSAFIMGNIYKRFVHRTWLTVFHPELTAKFRLVMTWTRPSVSKRGTLISFQARHFLGFQMRHLLVVKAQESVIFFKHTYWFYFHFHVKRGFSKPKNSFNEKRESTKRTSLFDLFTERPK